MALRNAHLATVDRRKVIEYLLNPAHPDNAGKAPFFARLGYTPEAGDHLIDALRTIAATGHTVRGIETVFGEKYVVHGVLPAHTERGVGRMLRTVWFIERGQDAPRLVTAYPLEE